MPKNLLIIISGHPATGKTTLGRRLSEYLKIPFLCRDDIKESLFDSMGYDDREWSRKIGGASFKLLYRLTETMLKVNAPVIIETFFHGQIDRERFLELKKKYDYLPVEINCRADENARSKRFIERNENGNRHPGHVDHTNYRDADIGKPKEEKTSLDLGGKFFDIDTTDFKSINYDKLFSDIKSATNIT